MRFNDEYLAPISPSDFSLTFLNNVVSWLDCWVNLPFVSGKLTAQTLPAFDTPVRHYHSWSNNLQRTVSISTF